MNWLKHYLAQMLLNEGLRVIEKREERVSAIRKELPPEVVVQGNGTDPVLLGRSGILDAQVVQLSPVKTKPTWWLQTWRGWNLVRRARLRASTIPRMPGCSPGRWGSMSL